MTAGNIERIACFEGGFSMADCVAVGLAFACAGTGKYRDACTAFLTGTDGNAYRSTAVFVFTVLV